SPALHRTTSDVLPRPTASPTSSSQRSASSAMAAGSEAHQDSTRAPKRATRRSRVASSVGEEKSKGRGGSPLPPLPARVLLGGLRRELVSDELVVPQDLRVVPWLDHVCVAGADLDDGAVVVRDPHPARLDNPEVPVLAAVGSCDRLHAFR